MMEDYEAEDDNMGDDERAVSGNVVCFFSKMDNKEGRLKIGLAVSKKRIRKSEDDRKDKKALQ